MSPPLEMTNNGNTPLPLGQLTEGGKEISRASRQKRISKQLIESKSKLSKDVKNVKNKLEQCQADFPTDDHPSKVQLEDAAEIIRVYNRADSRFITLENTMDDLKSCKQKSITKQYSGSKSLLTKDISNVKNKMEQFETKYIDDNHPCDVQLEDASVIQSC